ncbi:uncharacterized protein B0T23DRAFT_387018 [Neurospora hispaniola]|uniref:Uncharacterized protein n=1 Tax=Neurospora hispaniola TaxID=588809 RepID=A0AAJ0I2I9_9PEZI|nr:hypothetical protein B0T23DRAFT_387018 [Neurospora hispaniola]
MIAMMTRKEYYTRCSCPKGKLSAPGGPEYLVAHIHLPSRDNSDDFLPPYHADMERKNPGVTCQCSTERTRLPGRPDIIGAHFHGLSPKSTGNPKPSTLPEDTINFNIPEGEDFHWDVIERPTQDSQDLSIEGVLATLVVTGLFVGVVTLPFVPVILPAGHWAIPAARELWKIVGKQVEGKEHFYFPLPPKSCQSYLGLKGRLLSASARSGLR